MSGVESSAKTAFGRPGRAREYKSSATPLLTMYPDFPRFWLSPLGCATVGTPKKGVIYVRCRIQCENCIWTSGARERVRVGFNTVAEGLS